MLGAIIGDLAASTYEHDKEWFYHCLISPFAVPSDFGNYYLQQLDCIFNTKGQVQTMPLLHNQEYGTHDPLWNCGMIMLAGVEAWLGDVKEDDGCVAYGLPLDDKPDWYAYRILRLAVYRLRHGDTKRRIENGGSLLSMLADPNFQDESTYRSLSILCRCWPFVKKSFDFTSAIHNAARNSSDKLRHINCMFTGLLAEAMYGSHGIMIKQKYAGKGYELDPFSDWGYPAYFKLLPLEYHDLIFAIQQYLYNNRTFYPKNLALVDVERHTWLPVKSNFSDIHLSREARRRLLKGYAPSEDHKYALYYDDGWYYTYRGGIIGRFQLKKNNDNTYSIVKCQVTESKPAMIDTSLDEILQFVLVAWDYYIIEDIHTKLMNMFKFYRGEEENPYQSGDDRGLWWMWESFVFRSIIDSNFTSVHEWWKMDKSLYDQWRKEYQGLCWDEIHMLDYFAAMHMKWMPYGDADEAIKRYLSY